MKSHRLARFVAPPPPKPVCAACKCYAPEVVVPYDEGAVDLCWLCAHHHVDHGVTLSACASSEACEHAPVDIYPDRKPAPCEVVTRGEAVEQLQADGMSRQDAKALTFAHAHVMGARSLAVAEWAALADGPPIDAPGTRTTGPHKMRSDAVAAGMRAARARRRAGR